jgi:Flp pilus assembly pilin Flp
MTPGGGSVRWRGRDDGASSVEYALIAFFIAIVAATAIGILGVLVEGLFQKGDDAVTLETTP